MPSTLINDPDHWRVRATEARKLAYGMNDESARQTMLRIADEYDHVAERAEQRTDRR